MLTTGNMTKGIFSIALPIILANSLAVAMELANAFFLGRVGPHALAAMAMAGAIVFFTMTFGSGLSIGTIALVSRAFGEGDYKKAEHIGNQTLLFGVLLGIVMGVAGHFLSPWLLARMGAEGEILEMGVSYLRIMFYGLFLLFFTFQVMAIFQGAGDTMTPMKIGALAMILNIAFDPVFIFGLFGAPRLGVAGAAISTLLARGIGVVLFVRLLLRGRHAVKFDPSGFRPDLAVLWKIVRVGFPGALQLMIRSSSVVVMTGLAALFGPKVVAAMGVGNRVFGLFLLPGFGFGAAASTLVGQNLGARNPQRAEKSALATMGYYLLFVVGMGIPVFVLAGPVGSLFTDDPETLHHLKEFIRFIAVGALFLAPGMTFTQSLQGAGATVMPMLATAFALYAIQLPLGWFLSVKLGWGSTGVWAGIQSANFANAVMMAVIFFRGKWKQKRI